MSARDQLREVVGTLISGTGPQPMGGVSMGMRGPETPEQEIAALKHDVRSLLRGLEWVADEIEALRPEQVG